MTNPPSHLWLQVHCNFDTDRAVFNWSADGKQFTQLGNTWSIPGFQLQTFQGVRPSLFNFNTTGQPGGFADFDNYVVVEPRARGIEREIPIGTNVMFYSGADSSFLAADTQNNLLVNLPSADVTGPGESGTKFQIVDMGKGRVALKTPKGRFVSAAAESVTLKDLGAGKPGDA